jgi:putative FmdB family regulatory protein
MPIYEYTCKSCGKIFEKLQKINDKPAISCPNCGKTVKRIISQTSFSLKGEGWYKDGYTSKNNAPKSEPCNKCPAKSECPSKKSKD